MRRWLRKLLGRPEPPGAAEVATTLRDKLLLDYTGKDSAEWVTLVQEEIAASFYPSGNPLHPNTDVEAWLRGVLAEIARCVETDQETYDENMRVAAIAAIVFTTWASRIQHAKAYDPHRPVERRRQALDGHRTLVQAIIEAATDENRDADYFPGQSWNPPYGPSARGGRFV